MHLVFILDGVCNESLPEIAVNSTLSSNKVPETKKFI